MDWTAIFDDSGEEDLIIPELMDEHPTEPRLERLLKKIYFKEGSPQEMHDQGMLDLTEQHTHQRSPSYSLKSLYYLTINYILGVGCLGIPYAFARAGFLLCTAVLFIVTILSYMTVMWIAESGQRYEIQASNGVKDKGTTESTPLLVPSCTSNPDVKNIPRYEVIDLVAHFLGPIHACIYQISLVFLMFIGLLAYAQVFCGSVSALIWTGGVAPLGVSQLFFAVMVIPLSCMELDEQVSVQSIMAKARFLAIFIMVAGSLLALFMDNSMERREYGLQDHPPYWASPELEGCHMSYTACFSGFGVAFSTVLFSQLFQHSVPGLLNPLREQSHLIGRAPQVFGAALFTTSSLYLFLGTAAASYFGANTKPSVNLNFANFNFGIPPEALSILGLFLLRLASSIVVIFPAIDTISVFPLIAITLGNNLFAASNPFFLKWLAHQMALMQRASMSRRRQTYSDLCIDDRKTLLQSASKLSTIFWRLLAAIPPLIASVWATDLSFSFLLAGVAGIYVAFFAPCFLQLYSCAVVQDSTLFHGWYSHSFLTYPVLFFACYALYHVITQIGDAWTAMQ